MKKAGAFRNMQNQVIHTFRIYPEVPVNLTGKFTKD
jgi:hypothetical protein